MQIDFTVPVIDNYGDMGFALNLALNLLHEDENFTRYLYSEDESLFKNMLGDEQNNQLIYRNLSEYKNSNKYSIRCNFFAYPIEEDANVKLILNFDYLQFHRKKSTLKPGIESIHGSISSIGETKIIHIVPSVLKEWGWIVVEVDSRVCPLNQTFVGANQCVRPDHTTIIEDRHVGLPLQTYDLALFCYPSTLPTIKDILHEPGLKWKKIFYANDSFVSLKEFSKTLAQSEKLIIRGENSLVLAMALWKPFLWDVYRENFCSFLQDFIDREWVDWIETFAISKDECERSEIVKKFIEKKFEKKEFEKLSVYILGHSLTEYTKKILSDL